VLCKCNFRVSIAQDGYSVSWQCTIEPVCFIKEIRKAIMGNTYSSANHRVIAYDDIAQEMQGTKVHPENKLFEGAPQVVCL
jgi:hypothetical protein